MRVRVSLQVLGDAGFEPVELTALAGEDSHAARRGKEWLGKWRLRKGVADAPRL